MMIMAISELPDCLTFESLGLECNLTKYMLDNHDFSSALHRAKQIYNASPYYFDAAASYIEALFVGKNFKAIADVVETLGKLSPLRGWLLG
jgi:hypothetical protein